MMTDEEYSNVFFMSVIGIVVIVFFIIFSYDYMQRKNQYIKSVIGNKNVYCPSSYRLVKGDGTFTFDHQVPLHHTKTVIVDYKNGMLYTDKDVAINADKCFIKGK